MATIEKQPLTSMNITEEQLQNFKQLFPEVFTEGLKVDWEKLKLTLGETVDTGKERYGMNWPGKADCFKTIQQPSIATLVPARDESIDFDNTENLFIEGDNLEVLKLLQKSYLGKVKMIYIDPPYNTGNDFVYPDDYAQSLQNYMAFTGQVDAEGRSFSTNKDTNGRFHSDWLNMMTMKSIIFVLSVMKFLERKILLLNSFGKVGKIKTIEILQVFQLITNIFCAFLKIVIFVQLEVVIEKLNSIRTPTMIPEEIGQVGIWLGYCLKI